MPAAFLTTKVSFILETYECIFDRSGLLAQAVP